MYFLSCVPAPFALFYVGIATIVAGSGYVVSSSVSLFLPPSAKGIADFAMLLGMGELAFLWLLICGAKDRSVPVPAVA